VDRPHSTACSGSRRQPRFRASFSLQQAAAALQCSAVQCTQDSTWYADALCPQWHALTTGGMSEHVQAGTMGNEAEHSFFDTQSFCASSSFHCATARLQATIVGACGHKRCTSTSATPPCIHADCYQGGAPESDASGKWCWTLARQSSRLQSRSSEWVSWVDCQSAQECSAAPERGTTAIRKANPKVMRTCCLMLRVMLWFRILFVAMK
jgi:hypothetical protein